MSRVINIWFTPEKESAASEQEVADYVGISLQTLRDRLSKFGEAHYLTFFPGSIPCKIRRFKRRGSRDSKLGELSKKSKAAVSPDFAKALIIGIIKISQRHYKSVKCKDSRAFLLNENGMLEWYLESFPKIDQQAFLERMKKWVNEN